MRQMAAAKIKLHIGSFLQSLGSYTTARYNFQPISKISYDRPDAIVVTSETASKIHASDLIRDICCSDDKNVSLSDPSLTFIPMTPPFYDPPAPPIEDD